MPNEKIPAEYKADHLFLLIGKNPIPNFVAAQLLLKEGGQLYLVHSSGTKSVADNLSRYWTKTLEKPAPKVVIVPEAEPSKIYSTIHGEVADLKNERVGLHYTGGTKAMSVHAYRAMMDTCESPIFSYLDARSNAMRIDVRGKPTYTSKSILYELQPMLEDIVKLHASKLVTPIEREAKLAELAKELMKAHCSDEGATAWRAWCNTVLRPLTKDKSGSWIKNKSHLKKVTLDLPTQPSLQDFVELFKANVDLSETQTQFSLVTTSKKLGFKKGHHLCEWLDGKWLEYYALSLLLKIKEKNEKQKSKKQKSEKQKNEKEKNEDDYCGVHDCGMGIKPKVEADRAEFDVDLGVMQGYRMFAISCTTDPTPDLCKLKLFEAYERAHNMGGDETFVGLICLVEKASKLEQKIGRSWDARGKIKVFGRTDLPKLREKLVQWFKTAGSKKEK
ncbi:MAG: hypothetical protein ACPGWR_04200 [Ardenticatenaceae bacterium]